MNANVSASGSTSSAAIQPSCLGRVSVRSMILFGQRTASHRRKPDLSFFALSQPDAAGSTVIATMTEIATAIEIVSARSAKIWPSTSLQEHDRQEHRDRRDRRGDQRADDLMRALVRRFVRRHAAFLQAQDIAGDDDRAFDDHADGERESGQRDHVEAVSGHVQRGERRQQADRNRAGDQQRRAPVAHEPPHAQQRQQRADDQVFGQQAHRAIDEQRTSRTTARCRGPWP